MHRFQHLLEFLAGHVELLHVASDEPFAYLLRGRDALFCKLHFNLSGSRYLLSFDVVFYATEAAHGVRYRAVGYLEKMGYLRAREHGASLEQQHEDAGVEEA